MAALQQLNNQLHSTHKKLHAWYQAHGRHHLPWRQTNDPYAIYLSEIMLQQTQVATVLDKYYFQFLEKFPTLTALADAPLDDVLKAWEGLGYYTRARNLHKAAQTTAPALPDTVEELEALSGIGKNTAHAVAAFAFHKPVAIMEANVKRIVTRIFAMKQPTDKELWQAAHDLLDSANPFDYNQAMMDIGSTICTKTKPSCLLCPLSDICAGKHAPQDYPKPKQKKVTPTRHKSIIVLHQNDLYLTQQRTTRFLHGLYGFIEQDKDLSNFQMGNIIYPLKQPIGHITQSYSHFTLDANVYLIDWQGNHNPSHGQWESLRSLAELPLSRADSKVLKLLTQQSA